MNLDPEMTAKCLALAGVTPKLPEGLDEKAFQAEVMKRARHYGFLAYHTHDSRKSAPGFVDTVLIHPERQLIIVAELKVKDRVPTPDQEDWLAAFRAVGIPTYCWQPEDWGVIERLLRGT